MGYCLTMGPMTYVLPRNVRPQKRPTILQMWGYQECPRAWMFLDIGTKERARLMRVRPPSHPAGWKLEWL